jgi:RNA polymerase sigma factor (sigma-70 family)
MSERGERPPSDDDLLRLLQRNGQRAWDLFLDRYANKIFRHLQRLGFDYDDAMDCFTYVCEKLFENDFRRLRAVRHTGRSGELTPWLLKVVERLSVNWIWSQKGRHRLFKPIAELSESDRRVFELHFRRGLTPLAIHEQLRVELHQEIELGDVFDALERIHGALSPAKRWRLMCQLARGRGAVSLDQLRDDPDAPFEPRAEDVDAETRMIEREEEERMESLLAMLTPRERLIVQLRYEEGLELRDIGAMLRIDEREVKEGLAKAARTLRRALEKEAS